jgi:hypothetical protein
MDLLVAAHVESIGKIALNGAPTLCVFSILSLHLASRAINISFHPSSSLLVCIPFAGWFIGADGEDSASKARGTLGTPLRMDW